MKRTQVIWPFLFYFLILAGSAAYRPYMALYFRSLNFNGTQVGLLMGVAPLVTLVTLPMITGIADRFRSHKLVLTITMLIFLAYLIILPGVKIFALLLGLTIVDRVMFTPMVPLANSASLHMLGDRKELFGRVRLGGTIGFSAAGLFVGILVEKQGLHAAFLCAAAIFTAAFLVGRKLVHSESETVKKVRDGNIKDLLPNGRFLLFLMVGLAGGISFATLNTYLFPYMKSIGAGESMMGLALTIGTVSEIPLLFYSHRFIARWNVFNILLFALLMTSIRFLLLAFITNPILVLLVQLLNGFNYPLLMVAGVAYADRHGGENYKATAQGLFITAQSGLGTAIGGFVGGILMEQIGPHGMYMIFSIFVAVVMVAAGTVNYFRFKETHSF